MTNTTFTKKSPKLNKYVNLSITMKTGAICIIFLSLFVSTVYAKNVTLQWDTNADADYYVVYWGYSSGDYSEHSENIDTPETEYTAVGISEFENSYFAVKAFNSCGNSSDFSEEIVSNVTTELLCSISNPTFEQSIMAGSTVNFQGSASGGIAPLSYSWDFGGSGAASSSLEDPGSVTFSNAGTYTVTFTVTDDGGDQVSDIIIINVASDTIPSASIANPTSEQSIMAGSTVNFQGSASGGNAPLSHSWDFGGSGAASSSLEDPGSVTFSNAGTYTITFTVTDDDGDEVSDIVKINVASDTIPSASIASPAFEQSIMAGSTVNFQGSASGGNAPLSYSWDFGGSGTASSSLEDPGSVTFSNAGTYTITFTVTDDDGDEVSDIVKINVASDTIPSASIASPAFEQSIMAGASVNFQGNTSGGNGSISYLWDFDGGAVSSSFEDPGNVIFSTAGTYEVAFTVTDSDGDVSSDTITINVASDTIPSASITSPAVEQSIMAGTAINFQGNTSGGNGSLSTLWDFDGGAASSSVEDPGSVIFSTAGTYEVAFIVTDSDGDVSSDTVIINVASDTMPSASISSPASEQSVIVGASVNFQGNATGGNGSLSYLWDFAGGAVSSSVEDPGNVIFSTAGTYEVTFTVTDSDGDAASDNVSITVSEPTTQDPDSGTSGGITVQPDPVYPNDETNVSLTPELQADVSSQNNRTRWQISQYPDFSSIIFDFVKKNHLSFLNVPKLVLEGGTKYYWRVRLENSKGESSYWSDTMTFSTTNEIAPDSDSNGIPDNQEIDETVDVDSDGTPDIEQDDIKCVRSIIKDAQVIGVKKGQYVSTIELVEAIDHREIEDTIGMPDEIPSGLIGFRILVENPGDTAEIKVYFSEPAPAGAGWYKYDSVNGWIDYTPYVTFSSNRRSVSLSLTDGGIGDADGTENGVIVDPGGLGIMDQLTPSIFSESSNESGCFIGSTGELGGLVNGNIFYISLFGIYFCLGVVIFVRKLY